MLQVQVSDMMYSVWYNVNIKCVHLVCVFILEGNLSFIAYDRLQKYICGIQFLYRDTSPLSPPVLEIVHCVGY